MERESRTVEYKQEASNLRNIARTVVAFANGVGGEIMIGVEDKTRRLIGLAPDELDMLLERLPVSLGRSDSTSALPCGVHPHHTRQRDSRSPGGSRDAEAVLHCR